MRVTAHVRTILDLWTPEIGEAEASFMRHF